MKRIPVLGVMLVRDANLCVADKRADTPSNVADILRAHIGDADREHFVGVFLSARSLVIGIHTISIGTLTASLVHPREAYKVGILLGAAGVIVAHNHPSGDPTPSAEDREVTRRLQRAGELLGIPLADHLIIGRERYFSFRESGLL